MPDGTTYSPVYLPGGTAVYLNLSPQRYLQYREEGTATPARRKPFVAPVLAAGVKSWVTVTGPDGQRPRNCEVTYWRKGDRVYCFILHNAEVTGSAVGGGGVEGLLTKKTPITVTFARPVRDLLDERAARNHGAGTTFKFDFNPVEAVFLSFEGPPPGRN